MDFATVGDIAKSVNLSVRALEAGFAQHFGVPPMKFLRQLRLQRAHVDLVAANYEETRAGDIAQRWGFGHYGRFAAVYQRRYGVTPAQTLRRS